MILFSTLYPSWVRPTHGIFVETRLRELLKSKQIEAKVIAPVPWFPYTHPFFGRWAQFARIPHFEILHDIQIYHPRYFLPPKIGMYIAPWLLAWGAFNTIRALQKNGWDFDLIDAHYFYPDGVAAALLAHWLKKPLVITARGSDINLIAQYALPKKLMQWAGHKAAACIGVSAALTENLAKLGIEHNKLHTLRNGVDLELFTPQIETHARTQLGLPSGTILLCVGNLVPLKGHALAITALSLLPQATLVIIGAGPERERLLQQAHLLGVADRVRMVGLIPQTQLATWYSAADILLLPSEREGWPNVLLESMACGTPVVAARVNGTPEIVRTPVAGRLIDQRDVPALVAAIQEILATPPNRDAVRHYAEDFGWPEITNGQLALFNRVISAQKMCCHV